jgi:ERCC4-type nuclease
MGEAAPVYIDDRAGSRELIKHAPLNTVGELCRLDSGDAMITGNGPGGAVVVVGVEVKSVWDLINSLNTGRLAGTQLPALLDAYEQPWLLVYGAYRAAKDGQLLLLRGRSWVPFVLGKRAVPYGYVEHFLLEAVAMGIKIRHVADVSEAAVWIGALHRWWSKPWEDHKGMHKFDQSQNRKFLPNMSDKERRIAKVAAALPSIGYDRATAAARHFPSIKAMINATAAEWTEIDGIGKVLANVVTGVIDEE